MPDSSHHSAQPTLSAASSSSVYSDISSDCSRPPSTSTYIALAAALGLIAMFVCFQLRSTIFPGPGDFNWALETMQALLAGSDPYNFTPSEIRVPYPLPVALFGLPFLAFDPRWAGASFFGLSSGLLAYGILRSGSAWRLLVFTSFPYFYALCFAQWSPLIMAAWFFPILAPLLVLVKPQIALPVALNRLTRHGLILAGAVLAVSLLIYPTWPFRWRSMLGEFQSIVPLVTLPFGPLLLLALLRYRDSRARLLFGMAVLPFRGVYDLVALWLVPATRRQMLLMTTLSWVVPLINFNVGIEVRPTWAVPVLFIPALALLFMDRWRQVLVGNRLLTRLTLEAGKD